MVKLNFSAAFTSVFSVPWSSEIILIYLLLWMNNWKKLCYNIFVENEIGLFDEEIIKKNSIYL